MSLPRVVATGTDTLTATAAGLDIPEALAARLAELQAVAREGKDAVITVEDDATPIPLEVLPFGTRAGYRWLLRCPFFTLGLTDKEPLPTVKLEIGALALWSFGAEGAVRIVRRVVGNLLHLRGWWPIKVSRIDFACDFQGWIPSQNLHDRIVTRAMQRRTYIEPYQGCERCGECWARTGYRRLAPFCYGCGAPRAEAKTPGPFRSAPEPAGELAVESYMEGRRYTGARWGSGKTVLVRLYDKTREMEKRALANKNGEKIRWMHEVWSRNENYTPQEPVWRLEAQLRRTMLKDIACHEFPEGVDTVEDALRGADSIWHYMVGGGIHYSKNEDGTIKPWNGWIRLAVPARGPRGGLLAPSLWPTDPNWSVFAKEHFEGSLPSAPTTRVIREACDTELIARMAHGCAASVAAHYGILERLRRELNREPTDAELFEEAALALRDFLDGDPEDPEEQPDQLEPAPMRRRVSFVQRVADKKKKRAPATVEERTVHA